jgi:hypothetical protein
MLLVIGYIQDIGYGELKELVVCVVVCVVACYYGFWEGCALGVGCGGKRKEKVARRLAHKNITDICAKRQKKMLKVLLLKLETIYHSIILYLHADMN